MNPMFKKVTTALSLPWAFFTKCLQGNLGLLVLLNIVIRSSHPGVFLGKGVLKICSKFTGEQPCRSAISINLLCNFIEIVLRHGCSPTNVLHIFRTPLDGCLFVMLVSVPYTHSQLVEWNRQWNETQ